MEEPLLLSGLQGMPGLQLHSPRKLSQTVWVTALPDEEAHADASGGMGSRSGEGEMRQNNYPTSCFGNGHYPTSALFAHFGLCL